MKMRYGAAVSCCGSEDVARAISSHSPALPGTVRLWVDGGDRMISGTIRKRKRSGRWVVMSGCGEWVRLLRGAEGLYLFSMTQSCTITMVSATRQAYSRTAISSPTEKGIVVIIGERCAVPIRLLFKRGGMTKITVYVLLLQCRRRQPRR